MDYPHVQQCLDNIELIPSYLIRNLNLIQQLDTRSNHIITDIDRMSQQIINNANHLTNDNKPNQLNIITDLFKKADDFSKDKIELSNQTYELIDKHIRQLDNQLNQINEQLKGNSSQIDKNSEERISNGRYRTVKSIHNNPFNCEHFIYTEKPIIKKSNAGTDTINKDKNDFKELSPIVDPNEPIYCYCGQVYYGEMIKCDNDNCDIEWFHFDCVGITDKPKSQWFCENCQN